MVVLVLALLPVTQAFAEDLPQSEARLDTWAGSRCNEATARAAASAGEFFMAWSEGNIYLFLFSYVRMLHDIGEEWEICGRYSN